MTILSAISGALSIASSLKNLFGGGGELTEVNSKLSQILALSDEIMEGVSTINQNAINTKLSEIKTQLDTAVSNLSDYRASGEANFRDEAIQNSKLALAGIINYAEVIQAPKSVLVPLLQAASIVRESIMWELQDGAFAADFVTELQNATDAFDLMRGDFRVEFNEAFTYAVTKSQGETLPDGIFAGHYADFTVAIIGKVTEVTWWDLKVWDVDGSYDSDDGDLFDLLTDQAWIPTWEIVTMSELLEGLQKIETNIAGESHYHDGEYYAWNAEHNAAVYEILNLVYPLMIDLEFDAGGGNVFDAARSHVMDLLSGTYLSGDAGGATVHDTLDGSALTQDYNTIDGKRGDDILTGSDFIDSLRGGDGDDGLFAGDGDDILLGGGDDDFLSGGSGVNRIDGGAGRDKLSYNSFSVGVNVSLDVIGAQNTNDSTDTIVNVEDLQGSDQADILSGDRNDNLIQGGNGKDSLFGLGGKDTLDGGADEDDMNGGAGDDTYIIDNVGDSITETTGTDEVQSANLSIDISDTRFNRIENARLTGNADLALTGDDASNKLTGNDGNNVIDGGKGADEMAGGAGNDTYIIDNSGDQITDVSGTDGVQSAGLSINLAGNRIKGVENATLTGKAGLSLTGDAGNNTLTGNAGNNAINGGKGADKMLGGGGNDTYTIDNAGDTIIDSAGKDTAQSANQSISLKSNKIKGVENAELTGKASKSLTGDNGKNKLAGNDGKNKIDGQKGNDTLEGGKKSDKFVFKTKYDKDKIVDFDAKGKDHDILDLRKLKSVKNYNDLIDDHIEQKGKHVIIDGGKGDQLKLLKVKLGDLDADHFLI